MPWHRLLDPPPPPDEDELYPEGDDHDLTPAPPQDYDWDLFEESAA